MPLCLTCRNCSSRVECSHTDRLVRSSRTVIPLWSFVFLCTSLGRDFETVFHKVEVRVKRWKKNVMSGLVDRVECFHKSLINIKGKPLTLNVMV